MNHEYDSSRCRSSPPLFVLSGGRINRRVHERVSVEQRRRTRITRQDFAGSFADFAKCLPPADFLPAPLLGSLERPAQAIGNIPPIMLANLPGATSPLG